MNLKEENAISKVERERSWKKIMKRKKPCVVYLNRVIFVLDQVSI